MKTRRRAGPTGSQVAMCSAVLSYLSARAATGTTSLTTSKRACRAGLPRGVVLMDAGYGCNTDLRASISALALTYVAGILPNTMVWTSDVAPLPPEEWSGKGRPPKLLRRDHKHQPISVKELALC